MYYLFRCWHLFHIHPLMNSETMPKQYQYLIHALTKYRWTFDLRSEWVVVSELCESVFVYMCVLCVLSIVHSLILITKNTSQKTRFLWAAIWMNEMKDVWISIHPNNISSIKSHLLDYHKLQSFWTPYARIYDNWHLSRYMTYTAAHDMYRGTWRSKYVTFINHIHLALVYLI